MKDKNTNIRLIPCFICAWAASTTVHSADLEHQTREVLEHNQAQCLNKNSFSSLFNQVLFLDQRSSKSQCAPHEDSQALLKELYLDPTYQQNSVLDKSFREKFAKYRESVASFNGQRSYFGLPGSPLQVQSTTLRSSNNAGEIQGDVKTLEGYKTIEPENK